MKRKIGAKKERNEKGEKRHIHMLLFLVKKEMGGRKQEKRRRGGGAARYREKAAACGRQGWSRTGVCIDLFVVH